jgi:hypothetical protein
VPVRLQASDCVAYATGIAIAGNNGTQEQDSVHARHACVMSGSQPRAFLWPADRLKVTLASGYYTARLAVSCSLFRDSYESITYGGKTMLHWCEREVKWASDWLLKTYIPGAGTPVGKWGPKDQFVAMVSIDDNALILHMRSACMLKQASHMLFSASGADIAYAERS